MEKSLLKSFPEQPVTLDGPVSIRTNSKIFHAIFNAQPPFEAAVKHCLAPQTGRPDELAAIEQFTALQRVSEAFKNKNARFRVPTPFNIDPKQAIFSMSWVNGESLSKKLSSPFACIEGSDWLRDAGAWLGHFHQAGPLRTQRIGLDARRLVVGGMPTSAAPGKAFAQAVYILKSKTHSLVNELVEVTWLHGDCKADNFILSGQDIYGMDISLCDENPVEYDLAMFFNNLDILLYSPKHLPLRLMKSRFEKSFWEGYRATGPSVSHRYLVWVRLNFLVWQWHALLVQSKPRLNTWVLNKLYSKIASDLSHQLTANPCATD